MTKIDTPNKTSFSETYLRCRLACPLVKIDSARGSTNRPPNHQLSEAEEYISQRFPTDPEKNLNEDNCNVVINCDYLQGVGTVHDIKQVQAFKALIESQFKTKLSVRHPSYFKSGIHIYDHVAECPITKIKFCYIEDIVYEGNSYSSTYRYMFAIPGTPLRSVHPESWMTFVVRASEVYRAKFTRFDVRVDDYKRRVKLKKLVKLAKSGDVARVQQFMHIEAGAIGQKDTISTVYFGSKRRQLIIHNAEFLHDLKCDRWEARFREVRAKECVKYIIENFNIDNSENILFQINNVLRYLGNKALKIVDFIKRKGDKTQGIKRYRRYNFFTSLLKDIGELDLLPPIRDPKLNAIEFIQKSFSWFNRQVFKRFALLEQIFKTNFPYIIQMCMGIASERFDNEDLKWYEKMNEIFCNLNYIEINEFARHRLMKCSASKLK
ncbi:MAG: replication initiation factor domain-containing protein [Cyanobacteria bacterium P01_A01_bin.45]